MKVIQAQVEVGDDRTLHLPLPADVPPGPLNVVVVVQMANGAQPVTAPEAERATPRGRAEDWQGAPTRSAVQSAEERREAVEHFTGILAGMPGPTVDEFLQERREDEARKEAHWAKLLGS